MAPEADIAQSVDGAVSLGSSLRGPPTYSETLLAAGFGMIFVFGDCELDSDLHELRRGGTPHTVEPQVFDLLLYLIENRERMVSKDDLFDEIWGGRVVSEANLSNRINLAR